jgi:hypothetical protein
MRSRITGVASTARCGKASGGETSDVHDPSVPQGRRVVARGDRSERGRHDRSAVSKGMLTTTFDWITRVNAAAPHVVDSAPESIDTMSIRYIWF